MSNRIQRLTWNQTVPPTLWPMTLAEFKEHSRIDEGYDDANTERLIRAAVLHCEQKMRRQVMMATWELALDRLPCGYLNDATSPAIEGTDILLPRPKLIAVDTFTYVDGDGVTQTMDPTVYEVSARSNPGRIALAYGQSWPTTREKIDAVIVTVRCGYYDTTPGEAPPGETAEELAERLAAIDAAAQAAVPDDIKQAMYLLGSWYYENREAGVIGTISSQLDFTVDALLSPLTVREVW